MSREGHPPNKAASAYSKSRDGAEQSLPAEPDRGVLSSGQTAGRQVNLKYTVRVLDPFHDILFIAMFFESYTKEVVKNVTMCEGEAFVTFLDAKGAEKALNVPTIMAGQPISVYAVDPSEQHSQNIHMQTDDKASFEKADEIPIVAATDLKEPVFSGLIEEKKGIFGLFRTRWCVIQNGMVFIFTKQSDKTQKKTFKLSGYKFRNVPNLSRGKKENELCFELFREDSKKTYQFKARSKEDYEKWQECVANSGHPPIGNPSFGEMEVNSNKKQKDKRYQRLESSEYPFEPDKELKETDKELCVDSSVSTLGELHVRHNGYKVKATHVKNINVRETSDEKKCNITGIVVISRDIMVVCDWENSSVKLIDTKQNIVTSRIRFPSFPWDTALVPRDVTEESSTYDLIITLPYDRKLRYVRVTGDQIKDTEKYISVEGWCRGIQVTRDRKLAVSYDSYDDPRYGVRSGKVEILDLDGQVLWRLVTDPGGAQLFRHPCYLAVSPVSGILYVSDWGNTLTSISISTRDGSGMTELTGLKSPRGVTVDRAGSVFVCCWDGTVHQVTAIGDRSQQILGKEDGLCEKPRAIGLSPEGDRMYVGSYSYHVQEFLLTESDN